MPLSSKIFRVFVSSTFSDMAVERNALQEQVFPRLRELCFKHGTRFQPIDLRWGISQEAGLNQRAVELCLNEIKRCQQVTRRPNFLLLLGDRYGWCPLPNAIPSDEFEVLIERISLSDQTLIRKWYWRDDNAVPAAYVLQSRQGDYIDNNNWNAVEVYLRQTLLDALNGLDWSYGKRLKYEASVTEQEVTAGILNYFDAQQSAFCFFRVIDAPHKGSTRFSDGDESKQKLANLKTCLQEYIPNNIYPYHAHLSGNEVIIDNLDRWCKDVYSVLAQAIIAEVATHEGTSALEVERRIHENFMTEHTRHFVGRVESLTRISEYLIPTSEPRHRKKRQSLWARLFGQTNEIANIQMSERSSRNLPLVLYGPTGVGKSTLMARAIQQSKATYPHVEVLYRFIGVSPNSSNIRMMLISLCEDIAQFYKQDKSVPQDYDTIIKTLPDYLAMATSEHPLIIFLDALDQLQSSDNLIDLSWLPSQLPTSVRLVLSCIPGAHLDSLHRRLPNTVFYEIVPLQGSFAEKLLNDWLHEAHRTLQPAQRTEVLNKFGTTGLPLYLKLAFEEAKLWRSYTTQITLQADVLSLLRDNLFARLSDKVEHGEILVSRSMGYLVASRNGLLEDEILDVLAQDDEFWTAFLKNSFHAPPGRQLPVAVWSRLYFDLEPYLTERRMDGDLLLTFFHREFSEVVKTIYLGEEAKTKYHANLAHFYETQPIYPSKGMANLRKLAEQPYHEANAHLQAAYVNTVTDFTFLQASLDTRGVQALIDECTLIPDEAVVLIHSALSMSAHVLMKDNRALAQQLTGRLLSHSQHPKIIPLLENLKTSPSTFHCLNAALLPAGGALERVLEGHTDKVKGVLVLADGRILSWSGDSTLRLWSGDGVPLAVMKGHTDNVKGVLVLADGRFLSWSGDDTLRLWSGDGAPLAVMEGHVGVSDVLVLADGRFLSWSWWGDHTLRLWSGNGAPLAVIHTWIYGVLALADGRFLSWSEDHTLRLWSGNGKLLAVMKGHTSDVKGVLVLADGRFLSWSKEAYRSSDHTLRLWSGSGKPLAVLQGHTDDVYGVLMLADGRFLSWSGDSTLRLWSEDGEPLAVFEGHTRWVNSVLVLADGRFLSWSGDDTLRLWSGDGEPLAVMEGHTDAISGVLVLADGRLLSWSRDSTLRLWSGSGKPLAVMNGHTVEVKGVLVLADGRFLSWSMYGDHSLRLWSGDGAPLAVLQGHTNAIDGVLALADGRFLSWSEDHTLRLWSGERAMLAMFEKHTRWVNSVLVLADGRILSWSWDGTLRLWSGDGAPLAVMEGHTRSVKGVLVLADGRFLSWSEDHTLRLWSGDGAPLAVLQGHTDDVHGVLVLADARFISCSKDGTLRLWSEHGELLTVMGSHTDDVNGVLALADGRILSWSWDNTLRLWSKDGEPLLVMEGHTSMMRHVLALADGRFLSCSDDRTLRLWSGNGKPLAVMNGHTDAIYGVLVLADGRFLSWSEDHTLRLWSEHGELLTVMEGHTDAIYGVLVLADGRFLSWSRDSTLRLWSGSGKPLAVLQGHTSDMKDVLMLADGRFLSWSMDRTLRLWSGDGEPLAVFEGHTGAVNGVLALANGRIFSWSNDGTLRLWNAYGEQTGIFYGDKGIKCFTVSADNNTVVMGDDDGRVIFLRCVEQKNDPVVRNDLQRVK